MTEDEGITKSQVWEWVLKIMVPVSLTYFGWSINSAIDMDKRLTVIESNRYTPADALAYERDQAKRWLMIEQRLTHMEAALSAILEELRKQ